VCSTLNTRPDPKTVIGAKLDYSLDDKGKIDPVLTTEGPLDSRPMHSGVGLYVICFLYF